MQWQLKSKPLCPFTPLTSQLTGTNRASCHAVTGSSVEDHLDLKDQGPVASWEGDLHAQAYFGSNNSVDYSLLGPPSRSCPSQQYHGAHADPDDSRLLKMQELDGSTRKRPCKRPCSMRAEADHGSVGRACVMPSSSGLHQSSPPWRKSLQRGFLSSSATSHAKAVDRRPSTVYAPAETQVVFLLGMLGEK